MVDTFPIPNELLVAIGGNLNDAMGALRGDSGTHIVADDA